MSTNIFNVGNTDIMRVINTTNVVGTIRIGSGPGMVHQDVVDEAIATATARVLDRMLPIYGSKFTKIEGEVVVQSAVEGQTEFTFGLQFVQPASIVLYKNFPAIFDRNRHIINGIAEDYTARSNDYRVYGTYNDTTGVYTLDCPLACGDWVMADYSHNHAQTMSVFRRCVAQLAVVEILESLPAGRQQNAVQALATSAWREISARAANRHEKAIKAGIADFDNLVLVAEQATRSKGRLTIKNPFGNFM